ncbi:MAG: MFS transporter [Victivallales bacterium]
MTHNTEKKIILAAANLSVFSTPFLASSINIALPSIQRSFGCDNLILNWVVSSYIIVVPMLLVPFGRIADCIGRKKVFTLGMAIFALGSILCGFSTGIFQLLGFRAVQAVGAAMQFSTAVSLIMSEYSEGERGRALGLNVAFVYIGLSLGPVLGGFIVQHIGWRSIFFINAVMSISLVILMSGTLKRDFSSGRKIDMDISGAIIYGLAIVTLMFGFSNLPGIMGFIVLAAGVFLAITFFRIELATSLPILHLRLFMKNRIFVFSNLSAFINYSATFGVGYLLSLYFQFARGFPPSKAGMFLIVQPLTQAMLSPFTGRMSDKFDPGRMASLGMGVVSAGLFGFSFITVNTPPLLIILNLALLGLGFSLFSSPNTNAAMSAVEKQHYGIASSILGTMRMLGQTFSMAIVMFVASIHLGRIKIVTEDIGAFMANVRTDFAIFAALCFAGIFFSLVRGKRKEKSMEIVV